MDSKDNSQLNPIFSNEIRLGLVLYGGVSLAIYMNGVSREFYDSVRGHGFYKFIKALTDSDIVVDIISGTSAGGVNGILLAYALANSNQQSIMDFADYADLWIKGASLSHLFGKPQDDPKRTSILDGSYYRGKLEEAFSEKTQSALSNDWASSLTELDLFITATDYDGRVSRIIDQAGSVIDLKDHRTIFHLQHRQDHHNELNASFLPSEVTTKALAKLAQITSCFPVAFPVVNVALYPHDDNGVDSKVDARLVAWGDLHNRVVGNPDCNQQLSFVDGGVLSNRPFSTTIKAIYERTAYRRTFRKLFYVDPSPDIFAGQLHQDDNPLKLAYESKIDIPNYQSIGNDLKRIREDNQYVIQHQQLRQRILELTKDEFERLRKHNAVMDASDFDGYRQSRRFTIVEATIYALRNHLLPTKGSSDRHLKAAYDLMAKREYHSLSQEEFKRDVTKWDVDYYIRKHCFLIGAIARLIEAIQDEELQLQQKIYKQAPGRLSEEKVLQERIDRTTRMQEFLDLRHLSYLMSWQLELLQILKRARNRFLSGYELQDIFDPLAQAPSAQIHLFNDFLRAFNQTLFSGCHREEGSNPPSIGDDWSALLEGFYELLTAYRVPRLNSHESHLKWSLVAKLLPENQSQLSEQLFALIYAFPVTQILVENHPDKIRNLLSLTQLKVNQQRSAAPCKAGTSKSIFEMIDEKSSQLFDERKSSLHPKNRNKLDNAFHHFEDIDRLLFPFETFSGMSTRNRIDLVRVSPNDNLSGYGKDKALNQKLRGFQVNAFGGFFKEAWRSNDLLWGRLDGLDRLVAGLVTQDTVKRFPFFFHRILHSGEPSDIRHVSDTLDKFVRESLPFANPEELDQIVPYLNDLITGIPQQADLQTDPASHSDDPVPLHNEERHKAFLSALIQAGQRQILMENVTADGLSLIMNPKVPKEKQRDLEHVMAHSSFLADLRATLIQSKENGERDAISTLNNKAEALCNEMAREHRRMFVFKEFDQAFLHYHTTAKENSATYKKSNVLNMWWLSTHKPLELTWLFGWFWRWFISPLFLPNHSSRTDGKGVE